MPMKEWFLKYQPIQLYIILLLTVMFFITELICSHITHALTLLMDSYHTLCNILALAGCIFTMKNSDMEPTFTDFNMKESSLESSIVSDDLSVNPSICSDKKPNKSKDNPSRLNQENKLKNTFGWARIDVITMLICCIFMVSLSFSVLVEALQTLVHINHFDEMHHPLSVLFIGSAGLLINGVCYLLIGGYTFHQGSFLYVTESGDVVLNRVVIPDLVDRGTTGEFSKEPMPLPSPRQRQGLWEMCRDTIGCVLVILCALLVYFTDKNIAKFVDPLMSLVSATSLMFLSYPYMKESCLILLQTIPGSINIDNLKTELQNHFPYIKNVHDFHVWQLTASKIVSTVHIIFENKKGYTKMMNDITQFLMDNGITQVTIQPEFFTSDSSENLNCLMQCQGEGCKLNHCCPIYEKESSRKTGSKETMGNSLPDLRSFKTINNELSKTTGHLSNTGNNSENNVTVY